MRRPRKRGRAGASLEMLVAALERALGEEDHVTIESPKFVEDKVTGEMREHDVVVTLSGSHHASQIAIECRDRSRKITVNDVEAFYMKCRDTGIDRGVLVSPKGYSKSALRKATYRQIRALTLGDIERFDWMQAPGLHVQNRRIVDRHWIIHLEPGIDPTPFSILLPNGEVATPEHLNAVADAEFFKTLKDAPPPMGPGIRNIEFTNPDLMLRDDISGAEHRILRVVVSFSYEIIEGLVPFRFVSYDDAASGGGITQAAVAQLDVDTFKGKVICVTNPDQTRSIVFVSEPDAVGE